VDVVASRRAERVSLAGRPDNPHLPLVPDGICHAVPLGGSRTVCGLEIGALTVFPGLAFVASTFLLRCGECLMAIVGS
jgi:hypothetical protein